MTIHQNRCQNNHLISTGETHRETPFNLLPLACIPTPSLVLNSQEFENKVCLPNPTFPQLTLKETSREVLRKPPRECRGS